MFQQRSKRRYRYLTSFIVASLATGTPLQVAPLAAASPAPQPGQAIAGNVANQQVVVNGGVVTVVYDLTSTDPAAVFAVTLEVSEDGGRTYKAATTVSGDVGTNVKTGTGQQMAWEAQKAVETLQLLITRVSSQRARR
jgi:hypothetical protein